MKKFLLLSLLVSFSSLTLTANGGEPWKTTPANKVFVENQGQFPSVRNQKTQYALDDNGTKIYFSQTGITYSFFKKMPKEQNENEYVEKLGKIKTMEQYAEMEREERRADMKHDEVHLSWLNANPNAKIIPLEASESYFSYTWKEGDAFRNENYIKGYNKILYKDLYPGIDVEYTVHKVDGIKYALIVHPGADLSQVKMQYTDAGRIKINETGDLLIKTVFGEMIDHAPVTFYQANTSTTIKSEFVKSGQTISFALGYYDKNQTIIVDPWTQTPTLSNSNGVWECETDASGNVYIIGGDMPMKLLKYNAAGTLQWTYNTPWDTANNWLGTFATDLTGISYVTSGSSAAIQKVSAAGGLIASATGGSLDEYWNIAFNCDQTKLVVAGTRLNSAFPTGDGVIFDINTSTLGVTNMQKVGKCRPGFLGVNDVEEVRSITSSYNARYYFLTLDTMGAIDQNFSACTNNSGIVFRLNDGYSFGYKCEDWRPKGNSGIMSIRANKNFVYTQNGLNIQKRNLNTGAVITTAAIPGGISTTSLGFKQPGNSGIALDSCGNVYVGSGNAVIKYDANLNLLTSTAVSFHVYDVAVSTSGNIIACGATGTSTSTTRTGYVQQVNMSACDRSLLVCCDANVCNAGPFCVTDPNYTLTPSTAGGTWSGTGVSASGVFSPSAAGTGTHVVTYSLPCGTNSLSLVVSNCQALSVCINSGTLTATGGTSTYTWSTQTSYTPCVSGFANYCGLFTAAGTPTTSWTPSASGTNTFVASSYPVLLTDGAGQTYTITNSGSVSPCSSSCVTPTVSVSNVVAVSCYNGSDGGATASASPAATYTYTWQPGTLNGSTQTQLASGVYTVTASSGGSCASTTTVNIPQPAVIDASVASQTNVSCHGMSNGSASLAINGGTPSYTVSWSNSASGNPVTGLVAGTYTATITDAHGCNKTKSVTITEPTSVTMSVTSSPAACGATNGSATASASGGTGTINYTWNTGASGATLTGVAGGTYTAYATDANGCKDSIPVTITTSGGPSATAVQTSSVTCNGGSNGTASVTISGGTPNYTVAWSGGAGSGTTVSGLAAGVYTATVSDANNCIGTATVSISQPNPIVITFTNNSPSACTVPTGSVTANASGGTGLLTYSWNTGATGQNLNGVNAGSYTVTVTDANTCTNSSGVIIGSVNGPTITPVGTSPVSCNGGANGTATVSISGGTPSYTVNWSGGAGSGTSVSGLSAGVYTVTVTDAGGCVNADTISVSQPAAINVSANTTPSGCIGSTGSATATATGGAGGFTYAWSNSQTGNTATGLAAGIYTVTAMDVNSCTVVTTATVGISNPPVLSIDSLHNVKCNGQANGSAWASATGGTAGYTYSWSNGQNGSSSTGWAQGSFSVVVTDAGGCTDTAFFSITEPGTLVATAVAVKAEHCGKQDGAANGGASSGTSPYTYSWNSGASTQNATALAAGTYSMIVTDANGCKDTATVNVSAVAGPTLTLSSQTDVNCNGGSDGSASVSSSGGTPVFTYSWSVGGSGTTASGLSAGTYTATITDSAGCVSSVTVAIQQPQPIVITSSITPVTCSGASNGSASVTVSGGSSPYNTTWSGSQTGTIVSGLAVGVYTVYVSDNHNCKDTALVIMTEPVPADTLSFTGSMCVNDQQIVLSAPAGTSPAFQWYLNGNPIAGANTNTFTGTTANLPSYSVSWFLNGCRYITYANYITVAQDLGTLPQANIFSPNGDNINDKYIPFYTGGLGTVSQANQLLQLDIEGYELSIYDRWGVELFHSDNVMNGWDGNANGKAVTEGTYYWIAKYKVKCSVVTDEQIIKGFVQLIR